MINVFIKGQTRNNPSIRHLLSALLTLSLAAMTTACGNMMNLPDDSAPRGLAASGQTTQEEPAKAQVAIVLDFYDPYTDLVNKLKLDYPFSQGVRLELMSEYKKAYEIEADNQDIVYPTFYSLFQDKDNDGRPDINNYAEVYINSETKSDIELLDSSLRRVLLKYIADGGTLYVTEWTFQFVEPDIDQYI